MDKVSVSVGPFEVEDPLQLSDWSQPLSFMKSRHIEKIEGEVLQQESWRAKDKMKTWSVALVMCMNFGVDPPDVVKTVPCARKECWIDPLSMSAHKALEVVSNALQKQYERWQPRARYKQLLDPTTEEVRKLCIALRKNAKNERVLFHYNGHGVPKPTKNGEIWVFNKDFTQYIPLCVYDLQGWLISPAIYVYDCSNAGVIVESFKNFARQRDSEIFLENNSNRINMIGMLENCIQMAACGKDEMLPMNPKLPADLFTSCLTTPIKAAVLWYSLHKRKLVEGITEKMLEDIPGRLNERRTPLGELNWIFTAITDTIAWNTLPRDLFQKFFRQDLLVASLFRNFLLAERIMRTYNCNPETHPPLPPTYNHPMWQAWDLALDSIISQLPAIIERNATFEPSQFFAHQLAAFQVWLISCNEPRTPPKELPIVLQYLLSQAHRLQALELMGRYLDLGPEAVHAALAVGIFPYVLKLLGSSLSELQPILVFIWAKIMAVDPSCQVDVVKDGGHCYFIQILNDHHMQLEYRTMAAFVLAMIVNKYTKGQEECFKNDIIRLCLQQLDNPTALYRQWLALCLGRVWRNFDAAKRHAVEMSAHTRLYPLLWDENPEVRTAAVFALGTYLSSGPGDRLTDSMLSTNPEIGMTLLSLVTDGSPLVRKELVLALHGLVLLYERDFQFAALRASDPDSTTALEEPPPVVVMVNPPSEPATPTGDHPRPYPFPLPAEGPAKTPSPQLPMANGFIPSFNSASCTQIWKGLIFLATDPFPDVATMAHNIIGEVRDRLRHGAVVKNIGIISPGMSPKEQPVPPAVSSFSTLRKPKPPRTPQHSASTQDMSPFHAPGPHVPRPPKPKPAVFSHNKGPDESDEEVDDEDDDDNGSVDTGNQLNVKETGFGDWCCKYFAHSLTRTPSECDKAGDSYLQREYRFIRNHLIREESYKHCLAPKCKLSEPLFVSNEEHQPALLRFHPYTPHLAVMYRKSWSVWDVEEGKKVCTQPNLPNHMGKITATEFLNPHDISLLLTGLDDGSVCVWRGYCETTPTLVTAWRGLTDMIPTAKGGMVLDWEQSTGLLYASGNVKHIRIWDTHKEMKVHDMPTGVESCVTTLASSMEDPALCIAGFGDGSIKMYDRRLPPDNSVVHTLQEHTTWITCISMQTYSQNRRLLSCSTSGEVKLWDPAISYSGAKTFNLSSRTVSVCGIHPRAPLLACALPQPSIKIFHVGSGGMEELNVIKYVDGFMGQKIAQPKCLAFHPYKVWLAAGGLDGFIYIYSTEKKQAVL
eukprot:Em0020g78a